MNTAECVEYIVDNGNPKINQIVADRGDAWKRLSKWKSGDDVVRIFLAKKSYVRAVVVEKANGDISLKMGYMAGWDLEDYDYDEAEEIMDLFDDDAFYQMHHPSEFYFNITEEDEDEFVGLVTSVVFVPVVFYKKEGYWWDQHIDIDDILPNSVEPGSLMECIYEMSKGYTQEQTKQELIAAGFVYKNNL